MSDLSPEAKRFLERHAATGTPSAKQKARARAAALGALASSSAAAAAFTGAGVTTKIVVAVVTVAVGSALAVPAVKWARTPKKAVAAAVVEKPKAAEEPGVVPQAYEVEPAPVVKPALPRPAMRHPLHAHPAQPPPPEPVAAPVPAVAPASPPAPPSDAELKAEVLMVTAAQAALRASKPDEALRVLDEHEARFGAHGRMLEEAIAARIGAYCALNRPGDARAELVRLPVGSVFYSRLAHACW